MKYIFTLLLSAICMVNSFADDHSAKRAPITSPDGVHAGHEYVDLGLPSGTLWATCNLGANTCYDAGPYYAWGELQPKELCTLENYDYFLRFHADSICGGWYVFEDIGENICGTEYDVAAQTWGHGWRMPNEEERYELRMLCWSKWVEENGVAGVRVVGPNEHSIFLTTCGYASDYGITLVGIEGGYWVGIEDVEDTYTGMLIKPSSIAKCLFVDNSGLCSSSPMKYGGKNIRPVVSRKDMITGVFRPSSGEVLFDIEYRNGCLQVKGKAFSGKVTLYDTSGNMVFSEETDTSRCQLPSLRKGVYVVSLSENDSIVHKQKILIR